MTAYSSNLHSDQLVRLCDEVNRIANALARLSSASNVSAVTNAEDELPQISSDLVRAEIRARRLRARYFSEDLFADPAWDVFLDLFEAELMQRRISVSSACSAAAVPATTALRWITSLVKQGLLIKSPDPFDGRRWYVELSPHMSSAMRRYFAEVVLAD